MLAPHLPERPTLGTGLRFQCFLSTDKLDRLGSRKIVTTWNISGTWRKDAACFIPVPAEGSKIFVFVTVVDGVHVRRPISYGSTGMSSGPYRLVTKNWNYSTEAHGYSRSRSRQQHGQAMSLIACGCELSFWEKERHNLEPDEQQIPPGKQKAALGDKRVFPCLSALPAKSPLIPRYVLHFADLNLRRKPSSPYT